MGGGAVEGKGEKEEHQECRPGNKKKKKEKKIIGGIPPPHFHRLRPPSILDAIQNPSKIHSFNDS